MKPAPDIFPGAGAANLVTLNPVEVVPGPGYADIPPGPQLPGHSPSALVAREGVTEVPRVEVAPVHAPLPVFSVYTPLGRGY